MTPTFTQVSQEIDRLMKKNNKKSEELDKDLAELNRLVDMAVEDYTCEVQSLRCAVNVLTSQVDMIPDRVLMGKEMRH